MCKVVQRIALCDEWFWSFKQTSSSSLQVSMIESLFSLSQNFHLALAYLTVNSLAKGGGDRKKK